MKNLISKRLFGKSYDELPLATEILIDLKMKKAFFIILSLVSLLVVATLICIMYI